MYYWKLLLTRYQNILVCSRHPKWWVKLADFGISKRRTEHTAFRTQTGTLSYMAPEVLGYVPGIEPHSSEYTTAIDLWGLGCTLYRLVSGVVLFPLGPLLYEYCAGRISLPLQPILLSDSGISFLKDILGAHPSRRPTAAQALKHQWIRTC